jgi:YgiT-type zinc finger domain-containing protein
MLCDICGKQGARIRRVTQTYGKGRDILIVENVPVVSCTSCGETYFTAETLHELDRIKVHRKLLATRRAVAVAEYP